MEELERILGFYFVSLLNEGKRFIRYKSLAVFLEFVRSSKKILLRVYLSIFAAMLAVGGLFALITNLLNQYSFVGEIYFDSVVGISLVMILGGFFYAYNSLRERRLIDLLDINGILSRHRVAPKHETTQVAVSDKKLKEMIDESVRACLREVAEDRVATPIKRVM